MKVAEKRDKEKERNVVWPVSSSARARMRRSLSMGENSDDDDEGNIRAADGSLSLVGKWVVPFG